MYGFIADALQAYRNIWNDASIELGPEASLAPLISQVRKEAVKGASDRTKYHVLVVLVVGDIVTDEDFEEVRIGNVVHRREFFLFKFFQQAVELHSYIVASIL